MDLERAETRVPKRGEWVTVEGANQRLRGWWTAAVEGQSRPAVLMLHGCGGMLDKQGGLSVRMREYAQMLNAQGWHALALDSLMPRGEQSICTQRTGTRQVTMTERREDAWAALRWLAAHPDVDAARVAVLGWSNGGSAVLAATNAQREVVRRWRDSADTPPPPKLWVAFYPGCVTELRRGYTPVAPVAMMLGLSDDWTPAQPCLDLAAKSPDVVVHSWEQAYHGFDGTSPLRLRTDVPNGAHPGQGVHVGGHAQAREESRRLLLVHLARALN
ncbi:MAG TPA: dienelactone hydrolase family protein [Burkholderiaceae bacterium]|nr:dienelactone hydrolase family protein [Burkholderiaceae bacterium]